MKKTAMVMGALALPLQFKASQMGAAMLATRQHIEAGLERVGRSGRIVDSPPAQDFPAPPSGPTLKSCFVELGTARAGDRQPSPKPTQGASRTDGRRATAKRRPAAKRRP